MLEQSILDNVFHSVTNIWQKHVIDGTKLKLYTEKYFIQKFQLAGYEVDEQLNDKA